MILSCEQIRRRLAQLNVRVGDFLLEYDTLAIVGRADNHLSGRFEILLHHIADIEALVSEASAYFHGLEAAVAQPLEYVLEDGRKVPG